MTGVRDYSTGELKHNVVALAKAAKALKLPIIVTTTARDSMWGPTFPELVEALPGVPIIDRSSVNAFDDPKVAQAITATGRKKLIFAGISLEVCAAFPAITAVGKGLDAYVAVDASGTFSETKRQVGLLRMLQAGVILSDYATLMVEILKDNARRRLGPFMAPLTCPGPSSWGRSRRLTASKRWKQHADAMFAPVQCASARATTYLAVAVLHYYDDKTVRLIMKSGDLSKPG
jgi:nicotinamidase-related amidase